MMKLFQSLSVGTIFHYGDNPVRKLVKKDATHAISVTGTHVVHPHVLVVPEFQEDTWKHLPSEPKP